MNERFLCRGKMVDSKQWIQGSYFRHLQRQPGPIGDDVKESDLIDLIIQSGFADWNMPKPINAIPIEPATRGQCTGLHDKNGVLIFEGDIVMRSAAIYKLGRNEPIGEYQAVGVVTVVEDGDNPPSIVIKSFDHLGNNTDMLLFVKPNGWHQPWYVVGNIHDNPELMEAKLC